MTANQLVIVGRSGNGKTSCLETISKIVSPNVTIQASECKGVGDTGGDLSEDIEDVLKYVEDQMTKFQCCGGIAAFGLVLKFGVRYTQQEKNAVEVIKLVFGDDVFKKWGFVIFTYGDLFPLDEPGDNIQSEFIKWCKEQTGEIKKLFEEVDYRCVLFDNKTKSVDKIKQQVNELENKVQMAVSKDWLTFKKYDMSEYLRASRGRKELILREKMTKNRSTSTVSKEKCWCSAIFHLVLYFLMCMWLVFSIILTYVWRFIATFCKIVLPTAYYNLLQEYLSCLIVKAKKNVQFVLELTGLRLKNSVQKVP